ncbi:MAG: c-type cytochrome [Moraxella sp.]|nr:c-type cytochrome [Moraxella sp.]
MKSSKLLSIGVLAVAVSLTACGGSEPAADKKPAQAQQTPPVSETPAPAPADETPKAEVAPAEESPKAEEVEKTAAQDTKAEAAPAKSEPEVALAADAGKKRYETTCHVCHAQGLLDAPKLTDKAAWQTRLAQGKEVLYTHSAKGFNKMPAQAVGDISEAEVKAAVDYMLGQAGVS